MGIIEQLRWAFDSRGLSPSEKVVLVALAFRADKEGKCWPSVRDLGEMTSMSPCTVSRVIQRLLSVGIISRSRRFSRSNVYSMQYSHSAITAPCSISTEAHQYCSSAMSVLTEAQTEGPRKDQENKPKKKRERFSPDVDSLNCSDERKGKLKEWLEYKSQKRQGYVELGWKKFLSQKEPFTDHQITLAIDKAIAHGWAGFFPENEPATPGNPAPSRNGYTQPAPKPTFTENASMPAPAFEQMDFMAIRRAARAKQEEQFNGVHFVD